MSKARLGLALSVALGAASGLTPGLAWAQSAMVTTNPPAYQPGAQALSQTPSGGLRTQVQAGGKDVSPTNPLPVVTTGGQTSSSVSSVTQVTCGTASSVVYTGGSATNGFVRIKVQEGGSTSVYFNWAGTTATTSNSELMGAGESIVWGALTNSVTCITASGTAVVVVTQ